MTQTPQTPRPLKYTLTCSCGWVHETTTAKATTLWRRWHREQHTPKGSRPSESGHEVTSECLAQSEGQ